MGSEDERVVKMANKIDYIVKMSIRMHSEDMGMSTRNKIHSYRPLLSCVVEVFHHNDY